MGRLFDLLDAMMAGRGFRRRPRRQVGAADFEAINDAMMRAVAEQAGARWRRDADGSWSRWSYLGNAWEPDPAPPAALVAAERSEPTAAGTVWRETGAGWAQDDGTSQPPDVQTPQAPSNPVVRPTPVTAAEPIGMGTTIVVTLVLAALLVGALLVLRGVWNG